MTTKEIGLFALQTHGIGFLVKDNMVEIQLIDMTRIFLKCPSEENACEVRNALMYYPTNGEHSGFEFKFDVTISR